MRLVEPEADLQRDLEMTQLVVVDVPADVGDLEPVKVVQGLRGTLDGAADGVVDALGGGADDLADRIDAVRHWLIPFAGSIAEAGHPWPA